MYSLTQVQDPAGPRFMLELALITKFWLAEDEFTCRLLSTHALPKFNHQGQSLNDGNIAES